MGSLLRAIAGLLKGCFALLYGALTCLHEMAQYMGLMPPDEPELPPATRTPEEIEPRVSAQDLVRRSVTDAVQVYTRADFMDRAIMDYSLSDDQLAAVAMAPRHQVQQTVMGSRSRIAGVPGVRDVRSEIAVDVAEVDLGSYKPAYAPRTQQTMH
jgi:hypothetical protein